tara:strand:- start:18122 stop:18712 length:591 start_codon:yes stop_codon:yes gene_type:complete
MKNPKELFESIVSLSKKALGEVSIDENVVLADEVVEKEVKEEVKKEAAAPIEEAPIAPVTQPAAVSKSEFDSAIAEIKEMYTKVLESISPSQPQEVPEALSAVVTEDVVNEEVLLDEEVSEEVVSDEIVVSETPTEEVIEEVIEEEVQVIKEEKVADGLVHDPEALIEKKETFLYSQNRIQTTADVVFNSLFNNNK